jgi:hypothetical protein
LLCRSRRCNGGSSWGGSSALALGRRSSSLGERNDGSRTGGGGGSTGPSHGLGRHDRLWR